MPEWENYSVEYRVRFLGPIGDQAGVGLQIRSDGRSFYVLDMSERELYLAYSINESGWTRLITQFPHIESNTWYSVKVDAQGEQISIYLDNTLLINAKGSQIQRGWLMLFASPGTYAQVDDIRVVALSE